jgi:hypothetical protein
VQVFSRRQRRSHHAHGASFRVAQNQDEMEKELHLPPSTFEEEPWLTDPSSVLNPFGGFRHSIMRGVGWGAGLPPRGGYLRDVPTKNMINNGYQYNSRGHAFDTGFKALGRNPVQIGPGKWRSQDGRLQLRAKPGDLEDNHIHLEKIDPASGKVIENNHLYFPEQ